PHRTHPRSLAVHHTAEVAILLRSASELSQGLLEHLGIGLPRAEFVGVHPDVEEILDPESALESRQIATPTASRVRDQSDREALSLQQAEDLSDVREERRRSGEDRAAECVRYGIGDFGSRPGKAGELEERLDLFARREFALVRPSLVEELALLVVCPVQHRSVAFDSLSAEELLHPRNA